MTRLIPAKYKSYISPWQMREWVGSKKIHGKFSTKSNGVPVKKGQEDSVTASTKKSKARRTIR